MLKRIEDLPSDPLSEAVFRAVDANLDDGSHDDRPTERQFERLKGILPLTACLFAETLARLRRKGRGRHGSKASRYAMSGLPIFWTAAKTGSGSSKRWCTSCNSLW